MNSGFTVDMSLFNAKTRRLLAEVGKSEDEFLNEQARLLMRDVSKFTPPFAEGRLPSPNRRTYGTGQDKKAGEIAVRRDVRRAVVPVAPANRWENKGIRKAIRNKDVPAIQAIFENAPASSYHQYDVTLFSTDLHQKARDSRGRVRRNHKRLALPAASYRRYLKSVLSHVGMGKAYFAYASARFGGARAPQWIARHFGTARAAVQAGPGYRAARATAGQLVHAVRFLPGIERNRAKSAEKRLLYLTKRNVKKSGFASRLTA